jgi:hypothetical protein
MTGPLGQGGCRAGGCDRAAVGAGEHLPQIHVDPP